MKNWAKKDVKMLVDVLSGKQYYFNYPTLPIGGGNPYYCCASCGRSDPEINGELNGHNEGCEWVESQIKDNSDVKNRN